MIKKLLVQLNYNADRRICQGGISKKVGIMLLLRSCAGGISKDGKPACRGAGDFHLAAELEGAEPDTAAGPEDEAESRERRQELLSAIDALENTDREILLRKYFMSQNSKDIARIMHMTVSAVDTRAHRAVKKLRSILGGDKYE